MKKFLPFLLSVAFLVSFCAGGNKSPEDTMKTLHGALLAKNGAALYDALSSGTSAKLEQAFKAYFQIMLPMMKQTGEQNPEIKQMLEKADKILAASGKDFFTGIFESIPEKQFEEMKKNLQTYELADVKIDGDKATATLKVQGQEMPVEFIKENGSWKIDLEKILTQGGAPISEGK